MLPDMSSALISWGQAVKLKTLTIESIDFEETKVITVESIKAVVQPADKTKLNNSSLDWKKDYILIHKRGTGIEIGQFIEWNGEDFKVIGPNGNYKNYGFIEVVGESTNKALMVETV